MSATANVLHGGSLLGRYRIEGLLAAGGMGQVYRAVDTSLGRSVALKILPAERATDAARVERFVREARLASSLNHHAIVTVLDAGVSQVDGKAVHFLAMELVEGEPLDRWAAGRRRDLRAILETMAAIGDGLARAHSAGVIHRDLKPANVMVGRDGRPKILDFGVAKLDERSDGQPIDHSDTSPASIVGTAAYMSPEQVEGLSLDARSDIFSFGAVLYEVLAGRAAFRKSGRNLPVETMHAILSEEPEPLERVRPGLPEDLYRIVRKCLVKNREERYQSIKDVAIDLRDALRETTRIRSSHRLRYAMGFAVVLATVAIIVSFAGTSASRRLVIVPPVAVPASAPTTIRITNSGTVVTGAISPDGRTVAHADREGEMQSLWITQVATGTRIRVIPPARVYYVQVRFSPDGNYIVYSLAAHSNPNALDLMQVPLLGGEPRRIAANIEGFFAIASDGARVAFMRFDAVVREYRLTTADIETGEEAVLLTRRYPEMLGSFAWTPDGSNITFVSARHTTEQPQLLNLKLSTRRVTAMKTPKWPGIGALAWLPDSSGMLINVADRRQPPQLWFLSRNGSIARKVTSDVANYGAATVTADSKTFVANRQELSSNLWVVSVGNPSDARPVTTGLDNHFGTGGVRWLPDGKILFTVFTPADAWLSVVGAEGGEPHQLTRGGSAWQPVVSPDGKRFAFASDRGGSVEIWTSAIDGSGLAQVTRDTGATNPNWTPDGRALVYMSNGRDQMAWRIPAVGGQPAALTTVPTNMPRLSPDGKWLLCRLRSVGESGRPVWRTALLPSSGKGEPRYFPVPRYGAGPRLEWLPDGRAFAFVDFRDGIGNVWVQSLDGAEPRQVTRFDSGDIAAYDFSRDGRKLVVSRIVESNDMVLIRDFR